MLGVVTVELQVVVLMTMTKLLEALLRHGSNRLPELELLLLQFPVLQLQLMLLPLCLRMRCRRCVNMPNSDTPAYDSPYRHRTPDSFLACCG